MKYHLSPKTGRPNQCRAEKRACPVGGAHFDSKVEALRFSEIEMASQNMPKPVSKKQEAALKMWRGLGEEEQQFLVNRFGEAKKENNEEFAAPLRKFAGRRMNLLLNPQQALTNFSYDLRDFASMYYPGCPGCQPQNYEYSDYCRCGIYDDSLRNMSSRALARSFLNNYNVTGYLHEGEEGEMAPVINHVAALMSKYRLDDETRYTVQAHDDYYGEVLESIRLHDGGDSFRDFHQELVKIFE